MRHSKNSVTHLLERELSKIKSRSNDLLPDMPAFIGRHDSSKKQLESMKEGGSSYASKMEDSPSRYNAQNAKVSGSEMGVSSEAKTHTRELP